MARIDSALAVRALSVLLVALTIPAARASAQAAAPTTSAVVVRDSAVARIIGVALAQRLARSIAQAAFDTTTHAVVFNFPDAEAPTSWGQLRTHLLTAVRGRPRVAADEQKLFVTVGPARIASDTLIVILTIGSRIVCETEWLEQMRETNEVRATRFRGNPWSLSEVRFRGESLGGCRIVPGNPNAQ